MHGLVPVLGSNQFGLSLLLACEIDDSFTEKEALLIAQYAASDAVNKCQALWTAVKEEAELLMKSKNKNDE